MEEQLQSLKPDALLHLKDVKEHIFCAIASSFILELFIEWRGSGKFLKIYSRANIRRNIFIVKNRL